MQDPSDSTEINAVGSPDVDDPASDSEGDRMTSTVLAEVLPGVAVVFGEVPEALKLDLVDFGLVSAADRRQISTALASIVGNSATVAGNFGTAMSSAQGLYRVNAATQTLLNNGAVLAVKDGANLGSMWLNGELVAQARFIPVSALNAAQALAAIGPAVAMIGLQMQLSQITGLVNTNIALTGQVLTTIRHEQWAELTGLVAAIDRALDQAREIGSVPASLWDTVAGSEAALRKQLDLYRLNVGSHVKQIDQFETQRRREYLDTNAEAILFDAHALMSSLKAWTAYQALHAGMARAAGSDDADEARLVDIIARDTRSEFDTALAETRTLVDSLARELRVISELPGRSSMPLTRARKDSKAARLTCAQLLEAIGPLALALHPTAPPLEAPGVLSAPEWVDVEPYLRVLRWFLEDDETLRGLAFPYQLDALDRAKTVGKTALPFAFGAIGGMLSGGVGAFDPRKWSEAIDKAAASTVVALTDRRVITARTNALLQQGEVSREITVDQVRYVRAFLATDENERSAIDLITRDENIRWFFHADTDDAQVGAFAAVLAESMAIPDAERNELLGRRLAPTAAIEKSEPGGATLMEPTGTDATAGDAG